MLPDLQSPTVLEDFLSQKEYKMLRVAVQAGYQWQEWRIKAGKASPEVREVARWGGLPITWISPILFRLGLLPVIKKIEKRWPGAQLINSCSMFRRIRPDHSNYIYWHTDADGVETHSFDPMWNCWIPLEEVGTGRFPSLEVLVESEQVMRGLPPLHPGHRADSWVKEVLPGVIPFCPSLARGDVLVFGHYFLHRTQPMEHLAGPRIGAELRFTIPKAHDVR